MNKTILDLTCARDLLTAFDEALAEKARGLNARPVRAKNVLAKFEREHSAEYLPDTVQAVYRMLLEKKMLELRKEAQTVTRWKATNFKEPPLYKVKQHHIMAVTTRGREFLQGANDPDTWDKLLRALEGANNALGVASFALDHGAAFRGIPGALLSFLFK